MDIPSALIEIQIAEVLDSFLCATKIEKIERSRLAETINSGITTIIGSMKEEHMEELLEKARESILFSKIQKKQFLY